MKDKVMKERRCECAFCGNDKEFELPETLVDALLKGNLIVFAGAGISTEVPSVFPVSFYQEIKDELNLTEDSNLDFPSLMSLYVEKNGRAKLLQKIKARMDYMKAFPELERSAGRFHNELSTIFELKNIVTTNWDTLFEDNAGALPMVTAEDFAFWDNPNRKVFKIHGSINSIGSIVATSEDYIKAYRSLNSGLLGSTLKLLLATKTVLFVGYSFNDFDFNKIYSFLKKEMGDIIPRTYLVTPRTTPESFKGTVINTDGTYFIKCLKQHLVGNNHMIDDSRYLGMYSLLMELNAVHAIVSNIDYKENPALIYCTSYQDGLMHALERILSLKNTGYYSHVCNIIKTIDNYEELRKDFMKKKKYFDVAYIDGYLNGISYLWIDNKMRKELPFFYLFGSKDQIKTMKKFMSLLKKAQGLHKNAYKLAVEITKNFNSEVLHHTPFLY